MSQEKLTYNHKVVLAALDHHLKNPTFSYEICAHSDDTLTITPYCIVDGNKQELTHLQVRDGHIFGDESIASTLDSKIKELFG